MKPIITVEGLSKKFILSHEKKESYTALRDVISNKVKSVFRKPGQQAGQTREEFWALKDINFDVQQGDRVGIIGRNGAGKSTLLKVLSRITEPSAGRIRVNGRIASLLEVGTGFHPELTGRENIFLNGAILGMSRREIRDKFDEIVAFAEVEKFLDTPVKRYSSGMYVRLAFAVAAHLEPEILIVDEVLAVGDAQFQKKCLGKMEDVSKNHGRTVLFVSHNMGVLLQLCQKAILLKGGQLITKGETKAVVDQYMLNTTGAANVYTKPLNERTSEIYISRVESVTQNGENAEEFQFYDPVCIKVKLEVQKFDPSALVSVTLQNSNGDFLSTFVENLTDLYSQSQGVEFTVKFPPGIIAPNSYAFRIAVFTPKSQVFDLVEMICPIRIIDTGSKMAIFEGINYGSFFMDYQLTVHS